MLVFPIHVIGRVPFVGCLIECVFHVVGPVAPCLQGSGHTAFVIHDVDPHLFAAAKAAFVYTGHYYMVNLTVQGDGSFPLDVFFHHKSVFYAGRQSDADEQCMIEQFDFHFSMNLV